MNKKVLIGIIAAVSVVVIGIVLFFVLNNKQKVYTISFDSVGGSNVKIIEVKEGDKLTLPEPPTKEGFIFNGWADKENKIVNSGLVIKSNLELKAVWIEESAKTFTVHFDTKGGSEVADLVVVEGEALKLPNNPTKNGYKFDKWVDKNEIPILDGATLSTEDITLYAVWIKEESSNNKPSSSSNSNNEQQDNNINSNIEVESVSIEEVKTIVVDKSLQLNATVKPNNATEKDLTWESSNKNVITVDKNGKITAVGVGKAIITAKASNGKTATMEIESTISRISVAVTAGGSYISAFGTTKSVNLAAAVSPSKVKASWVAPDTTGGAASAFSKINGNSITITARNAWGSSLYKIPVYAAVGSIKSNTVDIYVEPKLTVSTNQNCESDTADIYKCASMSGKTITLTSNFDIEWKYTPTHIVKSHNINGKTLTVQFDSCETGRNGINVKAISKAGQQLEYVIDC